MTMDTLKSRDVKLEELWAQLGDIPMNPDTEKLEEDFLDIFPHGTAREEIWHWFDQRHSKGVAYLLYGINGTDRMMEVAELMYRKQLCAECDAEGCAFNPHGICMAPFLTGEAPRLHDDGCHDFCFKNTEKEK